MSIEKKLLFIVSLKNKKIIKIKPLEWTDRNNGTTVFLLRI